MMQWIKPGTRIDFVGSRKLYYLITSFLIIGSLLCIAVKGLNYGIDFAGGYEIQLKLPTKITADKIKSILHEEKIDGVVVQNFGEEDGTEYILRLEKNSGVDVKKVEASKDTLKKQTSESEALQEFFYNAETPERIKVTFSKDPGETRIKNAFVSNDLSVYSIEKGSREDKAEYNVLLVTVANHIEQVLRKDLQLPETEKITSRVEYVGPQVGEQLRNQGILAVIYSLAFMLIYIAFRFDFYFGPGAIVCLFHDTIVTVGVFSLTGKEFNLQTIAALLTIIGYSMNDTIVVFDRIRENNIKLSGQKLADIINFSLNETLSRTILTTFVTSLVVLAMVFLGGGVLADLGFALLVGFVVGTYSSIAVASPIYIYLREKLDSPVKTAPVPSSTTGARRS